MNKADRLRVKSVEASQKARKEEEAKGKKEEKRHQSFLTSQSKKFVDFIKKTLDEKTAAAAADNKYSVTYGCHDVNEPWPPWGFAKTAAVKALVKKLQKDGFIVTARQHESKPSTDPDMWGRIDRTIELVIEWN